jgi:hypothetical protein
MFKVILKVLKVHQSVPIFFKISKGIIQIIDKINRLMKQFKIRSRQELILIVLLKIFRPLRIRTQEDGGSHKTCKISEIKIKLYVEQEQYREIEMI